MDKDKYNDMNENLTNPLFYMIPLKIKKKHHCQSTSRKGARV